MFGSDNVEVVNQKSTSMCVPFNSILFELWLQFYSVFFIIFLSFWHYNLYKKQIKFKEFNKRYFNFFINDIIFICSKFKI